MSLQDTIKVDLRDRSYDIVIGAGLLDQIDKFPPFSSTKHAVVISDNQVANLYMAGLQSQFESLGIRNDSIVIEPGEDSKSVEVLNRIWNSLLELKTDRMSTIFALGGGVVGDLAGFAAASFARGIAFVQIPTSLLAQVDSSVGGKTGINLPGSKNMVGAFWQPKFVLIDTNVLRTLDAANFRAGLAEVVKYGVIMDADFFGFLENNTELINKQDANVLKSLIGKCCALKAQVVQEDERESSGRRAILNYGHTFGHAIENVCGYGSYLHGEAIAIGMQCAAKLAFQLQLIDKNFSDRQKNLLESFSLPIQINESVSRHQLVAAMHRDKKVMDGILKLILPTRLGDVQHFDAPDDDVLMELF